MSNRWSDLNVGLVCLARSTFDLELAGRMAALARAALETAGIAIRGPEGFVGTAEEAENACRDLVDQPPDLLVVLQATFADSSMAVHLARLVESPVLLWALPEDRTGGRLRLNSFCGINLAAHALKRDGRPYHYLYAAPDDPEVVPRITTLARAGYVRRRLRGARVGRVGEHPDGFDSCRFDPGALQTRLGVEIVQVDLEQVFLESRRADPQQIDGLLDRLRSRLDGLDDLDQKALRGTLGSYLALRRLAEEEKLDGLSVRCWPEFFTSLGNAACGAMSMLSDEMTPCSCETDINGTITQLILQWLSGEPAFGSDLVSMDPGEDISVLWHCGLAPLSMADPAVRPRGTVHSNRQLPLLMEFPLKPGRVTLARLSEATGSFRLVIGGGRVQQAPLSFSGTSGVIRFDRRVPEVLETIMTEGLEHHISLTYGDHGEALALLARMLDLPVLALT